MNILLWILQALAALLYTASGVMKVFMFDKKRSSWIKTPVAIRKLGGALYCCRSYGRVFVGSNGAESYYGGRGFRGSLRG